MNGNEKQALTEQQVLGLNLAEARYLTVADFADRRMTKAEFSHLAGLTGGYWEYLGEPRAEAPHMELRSGLHSGVYINCSLILAETTFCEVLAAQMIRHCLPDDLTGEIDWVVTAALAGITLGHEIGRQLHIPAGFVEKGDDDKLSAWRFQIPGGSKVLLVNELITTLGGSAFETKQTAAAKNEEPFEYLPFAAFMVDRCSESALADGTPIRGLFKFDVPTFEPGKCLYCQAGSKALRGKVNFRQLWADQLAHQRGKVHVPNWVAGGSIPPARKEFETTKEQNG